MLFSVVTLSPSVTPKNMLALATKRFMMRFKLDSDIW
jgi:hypothetical protein